MKRVLLSALVLAMLFISPGAKALDKVDDVYQIATVEDFVEFVNIANDADPSANALLLADLDLTSMGQIAVGATVAYEGTFDGGHHTITIQQESQTDGCALFGILAGTVKNLNVAGTIHTTGKYASGLVVKTTGTQGRVSGCVSTVAITSETSGDGTHGGIIALVEGEAAIENTIFAGKFAGATTCWGGFIGWSTGTTTMTGCLMIADVAEASSESCNTFARNPGNVSFSNCYYLNAFGNVPGGTAQITSEMLASGEVCFMLNSKQSEACQWFQTLGQDALPTTDTTHAVVFGNGKLHCNGEAYEGEIEYSNTEKGIVKDDHQMHDGICEYCHEPDLNYLTLAEDGYYELATKEQLLCFAAIVNSGKEPSAKGRLTAAIDLADTAWPSIGNASLPFTGEFDGQLFPLTNLTAPFIGTARGAKITRVAIESADIQGRNTALGDQTGSIVCVAKESEITQSYSRANIVLGNEGDLGGIAGKFTGTIRNCAFFGSISSAGWSEAGIAGSGEVNQITIEDCIVIAELITTGGSAKGTILGWNDQATISNCYTIQTPQDFRGFSGNTDDQGTGNQMLALEDFADGRVTWMLNNESFAAPTWYQTLSEDDYPTLNPTHAVVYESGEDAYTNDMEEARQQIVASAQDLAQNVVAQQSLIDAFVATISAIQSATTREEFAQACAQSEAVLDQLNLSQEAYNAYIAAIATIQTYVDENASTLSGGTLDRLEEYLGNILSPEDSSYPNGSYEYILTTRLLDAEALVAEAVFAQQLLDDAVRGGYAVGADITALMRNANLDADPEFEGWDYKLEGSLLRVCREDGQTFGAEVWDAKCNIHQTITGLSNGIYEVSVNAVFRAAGSVYDGNNNYAAFLYAGDNMTYVQMTGEDLLAAEDTVDGFNCYLSGGDYTDAFFDNGVVSGYCPRGPRGCTAAFNASRYNNKIVVEVTDGTLTLGLNLAGTGCPEDWMGFDNFHLRYLGNGEEAADGITPTLEGMIERAYTTLAYEGDSGEDYRKRPNFFNDLRTRLETLIAQAAVATTAKEKMGLVSEFSQTFYDIYTCKQAYVYMESAIESLITTVFANPTTTEEEQLDMQQRAIMIMEKWMNGEYTEAQAWDCDDLMQSEFCKRYLDGAPEQINGVWQLASIEDMMWFVRLASCFAQANAVLNAAIDMTGIAWDGIGSVTTPFSGEFDGQLFPITGLTTPLFGTVNNAKIQGIAIVGGGITGNATAAEHTGSIIGVATGNTHLTRSYSTAHMRACVGDCGGLIGKIKGSGVIRDCFFAGNLTTGWSAGCLVGSSDGSTIAEVSDCFVDASGVTYKNGDAHGLMVGWLHGGLTEVFHNCYVIAGADLTSIMGNTDNAEQAAERCQVLPAEDFASGKVAYLLNQGNEDDPTWFQTLGEDKTPVLLPTHAIVIVDENGNFANKAGDAIDAIELSERFPASANIFDMQGRLIRSDVKAADALKALPRGIYIISGRKVMKQ